MEWIDCKQLEESGITGIWCCDSCHDDALYYFNSYPLIEEYLKDGRKVHICCQTYILLKDLDMIEE